ncbi:hypothetical protein [Gordonia neofelifaecis]|uniref:DUF732 domain-containing protein n=1 Tax=Gordonia neofelifaecis NRRL B-59395 TaxID=644548 RepID=F1YN40_9ACTN|nr:hypothetical protein [Gordonia neofelifaecis]EGD53927.1 hypothetical protein SCNU_16738 [Gordonia neofelifaecis NRRL B-59395]
MSPKAIYWTVGGVLAVLLIVMVTAWDYNRDNDAAVAKAERLISAYQANGLSTPLDADQVAAVLGEDGGTVCATAGSKAALGQLKTQIGIGGEFYVRPILLKENVFEGLRLIVQVYCPDNLSTVQDFIAEQRYAQ